MSRIRSFCAAICLATASFLGVSAHGAPSDSTLEGVLHRLPIGFRLASATPEAAEPRRVAANRDASGAEEVATKPLPLAPPGRAREAHGGKTSASGQSLATVVGSLACIGALLVVIAWFVRRGPLADRGLPPEVFQHLGSATLGPRQAVHVVRFGEKLLLVGSAGGGLQPVAELTDPNEVQRLVELCRPATSRAVASTLQRVVADWNREPARGASNRAADAGPTGAARRGVASHA